MIKNIQGVIGLILTWPLIIYELLWKPDDRPVGMAYMADLAERLTYTAIVMFCIYVVLALYLFS